VQSPPGHTFPNLTNLRADATLTKCAAVCCQSRVRRLAGQLSKLLLSTIHIYIDIYARQMCHTYNYSTFKTPIVQTLEIRNGFRLIFIHTSGSLKTIDHTLYYTSPFIFRSIPDFSAARKCTTDTVQKLYIMDYDYTSSFIFRSDCDLTETR
jgi:hypothetical protein